ncbi:MAG: glutamate-cysteine ligase family protein [Polyangiaceae bacterium]
MGAASSQRDAEPVRSLDDLLEPFHSACKPTAQHRIGAEAEKIGLVRASDGSVTTLPYDGAPVSVLAVMRQLVESHGWRYPDDASGPLLALEKNGASVTLEPGGQLELSGAPLDDLHAVSAELDAHADELHAVSDVLAAAHGARLDWFGIGFHPLATQADLPWVPKPRYGIMREYLPTRGAFGLDMMRRTATVQANFDYPSEEYAMRCLRFGLRFAPFFAALFANSPFIEGAPFGGLSYRARVWLDVDPDRQGLVPRVLDEKSTFADYVEWVLDAPMFLLLREGAVVKNTGQTFRDLMKNGFTAPGSDVTERANYGDWITHLNTMFPEVRLKRTLEVRGGDSLPPALVPGPAALFAGLFYDERALAEAEDVVAGFAFEELQALRVAVVQDGPRAPFRGRPCGEVTARIVDIASHGLERRARSGGGHPDERRFLAPVMELASSLRCPADALLQAYERHREKLPSAQAVVAASLEICRL